MTDGQPADRAEGTKARPSARPIPGGRDDDVGAVREAADELPWVDDRASKVWVALIVAVFGLILVYGILLGNAGLLTPVASPSPSPSQAPLSTPSAPSSPTPASPASPALSPSPGSSPAASPGSTLPASPAATPAAPPSPPAS